MKNMFLNKKWLNVILPIVFSCLLESYIVLIENANLVINFSNQDFISLFSFKEFLVFFIIFFIIFYILLDERKKIRVFNFIYTYRLHLSLALIFLAVIFQIHGSSINELNIFHVSHKPLLGVSRPNRSDEFLVNTMYAFSQYMTNFTYFSDIVRATTTDMFIIYGQPVFDIGMIFRPFLVGYLFLNQGQGLSFFWIGRLIFLFLISFEFGMILTNKNKTLSLAYSLLITFSPIVQWWFAINGLVEQLIFGQLGIILINWYMSVDDYRKRFFIAFGLMISAGTFLLVCYPSWQIPFAYVFILLAIWIFLKNKSTFNYNKNDLLIFSVFLIIFTIIMAHILLNSLETLKIIMNTSYPGSEVFNGGGMVNTIFNYIPSIFFPLKQNFSVSNACEYSVFVSLFPVQLILSFIVLGYQKTKDKLLIGLLVLYILLFIVYLFTLPNFIVDLTLISHIRPNRLFTVITFIGVLILIRSISDLENLKNKKLIIFMSILLSVIMVLFSTFEFGDYYVNWMIICSIIFYSIVFSACFLASSKRNQKIFLICVIMLSFLTGALVNPIDHGTDVVFDSSHINHVKNIVEDDPNGIWIVDENSLVCNDIFISVGAKTVNSVNTYPDLNRWETIDSNHQYYEIYNRYAHIYVNLQDKNDSNFELLKPDCFKVNLHINDLEKLNISYIETNKNLDKLSNDNVKFDKIYKDNKYKIYKVNYT